MPILNRSSTGHTRRIVQVQAMAEDVESKDRALRIADITVAGVTKPVRSKSCHCAVQRRRERDQPERETRPELLGHHCRMSAKRAGLTNLASCVVPRAPAKPAATSALPIRRLNHLERARATGSYLARTRVFLVRTAQGRTHRTSSCLGSMAPECSSRVNDCSVVRRPVALQMREPPRGGLPLCGHVFTASGTPASGGKSAPRAIAANLFSLVVRAFR